MHILGLIPARGGSKGIPGKNLVALHGKPLLSYTAEAAKGSKTLTRVLLSTDSEEIASCGRKEGIEVPFLRPPNLALDTTPMMDVIAHVLLELSKRETYTPDVIVLLQPTSPLRESAHIDAAVNLLLETKADTVVSVTEVPHQFTPSSLMQLKEGKLVFPTHLPPMLQRQSKEKFFARNGPAVLVTRPSVIAEKGTMYGDDIRPLLMEKKNSIDIDDDSDLAYAEFLLEQREEK